MTVTYLFFSPDTAAAVPLALRGSFAQPQTTWKTGQTQELGVALGTRRDALTPQTLLHAIQRNQRFMLLPSCNDELFPQFERNRKLTEGCEGERNFQKNLLFRESGYTSPTRVCKLTKIELIGSS